MMTVKPLHEKLRQCFKTNYEHGRQIIWYDIDMKGMFGGQQVPPQQVAHSSWFLLGHFPPKTLNNLYL